MNTKALEMAPCMLRLLNVFRKSKQSNFRNVNFPKLNYFGISKGFAIEIPFFSFQKAKI